MFKRQLNLWRGGVA